MDLVDLINSRRFLGSEFLMWLWFKTDCYDGLLDIDDVGRVEVIFDDRLTLEAYVAETQRNDFKGGAPTHSPEAKTALRQGKRVSKAKMRVVKDGREWVFNFKSEDFDLTSVKIPALLTKQDDEQFYERMYLIEEIEEIVEALYAEFVRIRLRPVWVDDFLPTMQEWIEADERPNPSTYPDA